MLCTIMRRALYLHHCIFHRLSIMSDHRQSHRSMRPGDFDVESLRTEHESEEQWAVRKSFMLEHQDKFNDSELVTLAQLFTNIEFLGCKYPPETMQRISELAKNVSVSYRNSRKNKLKRTFVGASDAAEQKAKRTFKK